MEAGEGSSFAPTVPHFFKVMLDKDMKTGKLIIPMKFVRKYGTHLSEFNAVLVKVPTGDTWEVELTASNGVVQLDKGWPDLLNFYKVQHGDFLVFRYESGSSNELDLVIYNNTCTEVEYPKKSPHVNVPPVKVEDRSEDEVTAEEAPERQPSRRATRRTTPLSTRTVPSRRMTYSRTRSRAGNYPASKDKTVSRDPSPSRQDDPTEISRDSSPSSHDDPTERTSQRKKKGKSPSSSKEETRGTLRGAERTEALNRAKSFKSSKPHFLVVMQPRYVRAPYHLNVPGRFARRYMGQEVQGEMNLHVSGGQIWTARYTFRGERGRAEARVLRGWKKFVADNGLDLGDVCAFELIKGLGSHSFKVTIFSAPRLPSSRSSQLQGSRGGAAPSKLEGCSGTNSIVKEEVSSFGTKQAQPAPLFVPEHPSFQVVATKSNLSHGMFIPNGFMRDHVSLECKERAATLEVGRRSWLVKLIATGSSKPRAFFSEGFCAFRKESSLKAGDTCSFELIQRAEMVFRVSISRAKKVVKGLTEVEE